MIFFFFPQIYDAHTTLTLRIGWSGRQAIFWEISLEVEIAPDQLCVQAYEI